MYSWFESVVCRYGLIIIPLGAVLQVAGLAVEVAVPLSVVATLILVAMFRSQPPSQAP